MKNQLDHNQIGHESHSSGLWGAALVAALAPVLSAFNSPQVGSPEKTPSHSNALVNQKMCGGSELQLGFKAAQLDGNRNWDWSEALEVNANLRGEHNLVFVVDRLTRVRMGSETPLSLGQLRESALEAQREFKERFSPQGFSFSQSAPGKALSDLSTLAPGGVLAKAGLLGAQRAMDRAFSWDLSDSYDRNVADSDGDLAAVFNDRSTIFRKAQYVAGQDPAFREMLELMTENPTPYGTAPMPKGALNLSREDLRKDNQAYDLALRSTDALRTALKANSTAERSDRASHEAMKLAAEAFAATKALEAKVTEQEGASSSTKAYEALPLALQSLPTAGSLHSGLTEIDKLSSELEKVEKSFDSASIPERRQIAERYVQLKERKAIVQEDVYRNHQAFMQEAGAVLTLAGSLFAQGNADVQAMGKAVVGSSSCLLQVHDALTLNKVGKLGTFACTMNIAGAVQSFLSLFGTKTDPTAEQVAALRQELADFREETLLRLDRVDRKLDNLMKVMIEGFDSIGKDIGAIKEVVSDIQLAVYAVSERQNDLAYSVEAVRRFQLGTALDKYKWTLLDPNLPPAIPFDNELAAPLVREIMQLGGAVQDSLGHKLASQTLTRNHGNPNLKNAALDIDENILQSSTGANQVLGNPGNGFSPDNLSYLGAVFKDAFGKSLDNPENRKMKEFVQMVEAANMVPPSVYLTAAKLLQGVERECREDGTDFASEWGQSLAEQGEKIVAAVALLRSPEVHASLLRLHEELGQDFLSQIETYAASFYKGRGLAVPSVWGSKLPTGISNPFVLSDQLTHVIGPISKPYKNCGDLTLNALAVNAIPPQAQEAQRMGLGTVRASMAMEWVEGKKWNTKETMEGSDRRGSREITVSHYSARPRFAFFIDFVKRDGTSLPIRIITARDKAVEIPSGSDKQMEKYFNKHKEALVNAARSFFQTSDYERTSQDNGQSLGAIANLMNDEMKGLQTALENAFHAELSSVGSSSLQNARDRLIGFNRIMSEVEAICYGRENITDDLAFATSSVDEGIQFTRQIEDYRAWKKGAGDSAPLTLYLGCQLRKSLGYKDGRPCYAPAFFGTEGVMLPSAMMLADIATDYLDPELERALSRMALRKQLNDGSVLPANPVVNRDISGASISISSRIDCEGGLPGAFARASAQGVTPTWVQFIERQNNILKGLGLSVD